MKETYQMFEHDCLLACFSTVLKYKKVKHSYSTLLNELIVNENINLLKLKKIALKYKVQVQYFKSDELFIYEKQKQPVIVQTFDEGLAHFMVLIKSTNLGVKVFDPSVGYRFYLYHEFEKIFTGLVIKLTFNKKAILLPKPTNIKIGSSKLIQLVIMINIISGILLLGSTLVLKYFSELTLKQTNATGIIQIMAILVVIILIKAFLDHYLKFFGLKKISELSKTSLSMMYENYYQLQINIRNWFSEANLIELSNYFNNYHHHLIATYSTLISSTMLIIIFSLYLSWFKIKFLLLILGYILIFGWFNIYFKKYINYIFIKSYQLNMLFVQSVLAFFNQRNMFAFLNQQTIDQKGLDQNINKLYHLSIKAGWLDLVINFKNEILNEIFNKIMLGYLLYLYVIKDITLVEVLITSAIGSYLIESLVHLFQASVSLNQLRLMRFKIQCFLQLKHSNNIKTNQITFTNVLIKKASQKIVEIDHLNLELNQKYFLEGSHGQGKTTFLECLAFQKANYTGEILINNQKIIPNDIILLTSSSDFNYQFDQKQLEKISKLIYELNLNEQLNFNSLDFKNFKYQALSLGQRQIFNLLYLISLDIKVYLLDECLSNVTRSIQECLINYLLSLEVMVIYVSFEKDVYKGFDWCLKIENHRLSKEKIG